jgi:hypothetical protein
MKISIKIKNKLLFLDFPHEDTVCNLKNYLHILTGIPREYQILRWMNTTLKDHVQLTSYAMNPLIPISIWQVISSKNMNDGSQENKEAIMHDPPKLNLIKFLEKSKTIEFDHFSLNDMQKIFNFESFHSEKKIYFNKSVDDVTSPTLSVQSNADEIHLSSYEDKKNLNHEKEAFRQNLSLKLSHIMTSSVSFIQKLFHLFNLTSENKPKKPPES